MDKQQKIAIFLLPLLAIAIVAGGMFLMRTPTEAAGYIDGTYTGTGQGYGGEITVAVTIQGGKISAIDLVDINDTPGLGDDAANQVIDSVIASQSTEVDVVSGATASSNGTIEAINMALVKASGGTGYPDGVHEGIGDGYGGDIKVKVEVAGGKIVSIELLEINDTPGFGDDAAKAIIDSIIETQSTEVDIVTGATASSNGTIQAVRVALGLEKSSEDVAALAPEPMTFSDGIYEGSAKGFSNDGDIKVRVEVIDSKIVSIEVLEISDTPSIGDTAAENTIAKIIEFQSTSIDALTGATKSSEGTINAVIAALANGTISLEEVVEEEVVEEAKAEEKPEETKKTEEAKTEEKPQEQKPALKDGTYVGEAKGYKEGYDGSIIRVTVTVKDGKVTKVELDKALAAKTQTAGYGDVSAQQVVDAANKLGITLETISQVNGIDGMSGATESADGAKNAIKNALDKAK